MAASVYTAAQSATQLECSSQQSLFFHTHILFISMGRTDKSASYEHSLQDSNGERVKYSRVSIIGGAMKKVIWNKTQSRLNHFEGLKLFSA